MFSLHHVARVSILILAIVSIVTTACGGDSGNTVDAGTSSDTALPITETASAYAVTLQSVQLTEQDSVFDFRIARADNSNQPSLERYLPLTPADVRMEGLLIKDATLGSYKPVLADDGSSVTALDVRLVFEPIVDTGPEVGISFLQLSFSAVTDADPEVRVKGPWEFAINPRDIIDVGLRTVEVSNATQRQGMTFSVQKVAFYPTRTLVDFAIDSSLDGQMEPSGIVAQSGDGELSMAKAVTSRDDGSSTAEFPAFPVDAPLTLNLVPLLQEVRQPATVTIPIVDHAADSTRSADGIAVQQRFEVDGEQLVVRELSLESDSFTIRVENVTPDRSGTVLMYYPKGGAGVHLSDDLGNTYELVGASTNFGKESLLSMWADGSSFTFANTIADGASSLTLSVASYGKQLRGPWELTVPAE